MEIGKIHKPYFINKFLLDFLGLIAGLALCYWMASRFEGLEQWFDGRRSDGYGFFIGLALIAFCLWDMIKNLIKLIKSRRVEH